LKVFNEALHECPAAKEERCRRERLSIFFIDKREAISRSTQRVDLSHLRKRANPRYDQLLDLSILTSDIPPPGREKRDGLTIVSFLTPSG